MVSKNPFTCGFFKVKVNELMSKCSTILGKNVSDNRAKSCVYTEHCKEIKEFFKDGRFTFDETSYRKIGPVMSQIFKSLGHNSPEKRQRILQTFNQESWEKLSNEEKKRHSVVDCKGCLGNRNFKHGLSLFPISNFYKTKAIKHGLIRKPLQNISNICEKQKERSCEEDRERKREYSCC